MKGDKIKIIDIKDDEHNILCAFPNIGDPIPVGLIDGYLEIPCYVEYYENGDKFYRLVEEE